MLLVAKLSISMAFSRAAIASDTAPEIEMLRRCCIRTGERRREWTGVGKQNFLKVRTFTENGIEGVERGPL